MTRRAKKLHACARISLRLRLPFAVPEILPQFRGILLILNVRMSLDTGSPVTTFGRYCTQCIAEMASWYGSRRRRMHQCG